MIGPMQVGRSVRKETARYLSSLRAPMHQEIRWRKTKWGTGCAVNQCSSKLKSQHELLRKRGTETRMVRYKPNSKTSVSTIRARMQLTECRSPKVGHDITWDVEGKGFSLLFSPSLRAVSAYFVVHLTSYIVHCTSYIWYIYGERRTSPLGSDSYKDGVTKMIRMYFCIKVKMRCLCLVSGDY